MIESTVNTNKCAGGAFLDNICFNQEIAALANQEFARLKPNLKLLAGLGGKCS